MFAIDVIPIARGILKEKLSYFSAEKVPVGSLVEIPLRSKSAKALVIGQKEISEIKATLRQADYSLKKLSSLKTKHFLSEEFLESAREAGHFFGGTTGAVLNNLVPKSILENPEKCIPITIPVSPKDSHEKLLIQADEEERFSLYKRLIREEFAKNLSVLFIVPTIEDVRKAKESLEKGIENYTACFSSDLKKKEMIGVWNRILSESHPLLVIGTPQIMSHPRTDFNILILERENSSVYRELKRPYMDMRVFAEIFSKRMKIKLLLGDTSLRTETLWREKNLEFADIAPLKSRLAVGVNQTLALLKKERGQEFSPLSPELIALLEKHQKNNDSFFIFGARKGLYLSLQCNDCSESVACPNCSALSVLHQDGKERFLLCNKCGLKRKVVLKCEHCGSWRLEPLGIGLELVEESIKKRFSDLSLIRVDKESAKSAKEVKQKIAKWRETPHSILLGTEVILPYLREKMDTIVCAALDSLFSIPDFRINEKIFSLLLRLRGLSEKNFLIQTKNPQLKIWQNVFDGALAEFYREEIEQRKLLGYPPFSLLIKITIQGQKEATEKEAKKVAELFKTEDPHVYPSFIAKIKGQYSMNILLRLPPKSWPNEELRAKLLSLSPKFLIKVDPDNIL